MRRIDRDHTMLQRDILRERMQKTSVNDDCMIAVSMRSLG